MKNEHFCSIVQKKRSLVPKKSSKKEKMEETSKKRRYSYSAKETDIIEF